MPCFRANFLSVSNSERPNIWEKCIFSFFIFIFKPKKISANSPFLWAKSGFVPQLKMLPIIQGFQKTPHFYWEFNLICLCEIDSPTSGLHMKCRGTFISKNPLSWYYLEPWLLENAIVEISWQWMPSQITASWPMKLEFFTEAWPWIIYSIPIAVSTTSQLARLCMNFIGKKVLGFSKYRFQYWSTKVLCNN